MNNIPQEELNFISEEAENFIDIINNGVDWINQYGKNSHHKEQTNYKLKKYRRELKKIKEGVVQKNAIGLFGKSQVGKSYLVKNILCDIDNYLYITNPLNKTDKRDFHRKINPSGQGEESTGLVTRFTVYKEGEFPTTYENYPIKLKLLSPKDFVLIIVDTFRSDIEKYQLEANKDEVINFLEEELPTLYTNESQYYLTEDDIYSIQEYIGKYFIEDFVLIPYWTKIATNIHRVQPMYWSVVFNILWNKHAKFTKLFTDLVLELKKMNFSKVVYTDFEAVKRDDNNIIEVKRLVDFYTGDNVLVNAKLESGEELEINKHRLGAIAKELVLNVSDESADEHPFICDTDILDFPGARARKKFSSTLTDETFGQCLVRGKVAYLFNLYSTNYEANNLFVCTPDKQNNVNELPGLINTWIADNLGATKEQRTQILDQFNSCPLFLIFTFWNNQLTFHANADGGEESLDYKWEKRFDSFYLDGVIGDRGVIKWDLEWTNTTAFKNYYLLRDFEHSGDTFEGYNPEVAGSGEIGIRVERDRFYDRLRESFVKSPRIKKFFKNPDDIWEKTSTPTNDGSQYIIENIKKVATNQIKTTKFKDMLKEIKAHIFNDLKAHYHSDDLGAEIAKSERDAIDISGQMSQVFGKNLFYFGSFIERLSVSEKDILDKYNEEFDALNIIIGAKEGPYILFLSRSPRLSSENSEEDNLKILAEDYKLENYTSDEIKDHFLKKYTIDIQQLFSEWNTQKDPSIALAEIARNLWYNNMTIENFTLFIDKGLDEVLLGKLFDNLKQTFNRLGVVQLIGGLISRYVDTYKKTSAAKDLISDVTASMINNFIKSSGWDLYPLSEQNDIRATCKANKLIFRPPPFDEPDFEEVDSNKISELFDFMEAMNESLSKSSIDAKVMAKVPVIKNYNEWIDLMQLSFIANCKVPNYDIEGNKHLGKIIEKIDSIRMPNTVSE